LLEPQDDISMDYSNAYMGGKNGFLVSHQFPSNYYEPRQSDIL